MRTSGIGIILVALLGVGHNGLAQDDALARVAAVKMAIAAGYVRVPAEGMVVIIEGSDEPGRPVRPGFRAQAEQIARLLGGNSRAVSRDVGMNCVPSPPGHYCTARMQSVLVVSQGTLRPDGTCVVNVTVKMPPPDSLRVPGRDLIAALVYLEPNGTGWRAVRISRISP